MCFDEENTVLFFQFPSIMPSFKSVNDDIEMNLNGASTTTEALSKSGMNENSHTDKEKDKHVYSFLENVLEKNLQGQIGELIVNEDHSTRMVFGDICFNVYCYLCVN